MSNRHPHEIAAIEVLIRHLNEVDGRLYEVTKEHVPVGYKNCDYLLSDAGSHHQVAVEIVRLIDDPRNMELHRKRAVLWQALRAHCASNGLSGFIVHTPYRFEEPQRVLVGQLAPRIARDVAAIVRDDPERSEISINGFEFKAAKGFHGVGFTSSGTAYWVDKERIAKRIFETFIDKDLQLDVSGAKRVIAAVPTDTSLDPNEIIWELASRGDLDKLVHADEVVVVLRDRVSTVYSRRVRDYLSGVASFPFEHAALADVSLQSRLAENIDGTFELVCAYRERIGPLQNLSVEFRRELTRHGDHLVRTDRRAEARWIIDDCMNDPDPAPDCSDDPIVTVRGSLAFLLEKLIASESPERVPAWISAVRQLARDAHMGVRSAAVHPMNTLLAWRDQLHEGRPALDERTRADIKRLWLEFVTESLKRADGERAARTLVYIQHDSSVDEVLEFVGVLRGRDLGDAPEVFARFLIYFAFLRSSDPGLPKPFDDNDLRARTAELARENADLARTLAYVTRNSARDHSELRPVLGPLLTMLLTTPQDDLGLRWALEAATFLAEDGLLTVPEGEALCSAVRVNSPFPEFRAWGIADALKDLVDALERRPNGLPAIALLSAVTDPATAGLLAEMRAS